MAAKSVSKKDLEAMLKPDLIKLAQGLGIETKSLSKEQLVKAVVDFGSAPETGVDDVVGIGLNATKPVVDVTTPSVEVAENIEIMKMKLQMEHEFRLREFDRLDKQREFDRLERDKQRDLEERDRDKQRDHEFKMAQLKVQTERGLPSDSKAVPQFRVDSAAKLLPKLVSEQETETFLITFEKIANLNKWPKEHWAAVLQTQLKGKGLKVFSELSLQECRDYEKLKKAILTAYELCSEVYRKRFRTSKKVSTESHSDFAFDLTQSFKRWLISVKSWDDIELLRETFLKEQFMESVPTELKLWLTDRDPKSLEEMAKLADQFVTLRKAISPAEHYQEIQDNMLVSARPFVKSTRPWVKPNVPVVVDKVVESPVEKRDKLYSRSDLSQVRCFYCEKTGHKIAQCRAKQQKEEKEVKKDVCSKDSSASQSFLVCDCRPIHSNGEVAFPLPIHPLFKPFCATAHIVNLNGLQAPINVLRDTGTLQSVIKQATLTNIDYVKTEQVRLLKKV
jgi:hypothetical protein